MLCRADEQSCSVPTRGCFFVCFIMKRVFTGLGRAVFSSKLSFHAEI